MNSIREQALRRLDLFQKALYRSQRISERATRWEARLALVRLVVIVSALAALSAAWSLLSSDGKAGALAVAFAGILGVVLTHLHIRKVRNRWGALTRSYELSTFRYARNFPKIEAYTNPWSQKVSSPAGHPYAHDLDIVERFFPLLDTCATPAGSQSLLGALLSASVEPPTESIRMQRVRRAKVFSHKTSLLRRLEAFRLSEANIADYHRNQALDESKREYSPLPSRVQLLAAVAAGVGILSWFALALPPFLTFITTGKGEPLLRALTFYAPLPLLGILAFRPVTALASGILRTARASQVLLKEVEPLSRHEDFCQLSCFQLHARKNLRLLALAVDLISVRNNPILWLILHAILPWDSLACLFLMFLTRRTGAALSTWQSELAELDFTSALGRFSAENPHCQFVERDTQDPTSAELIMKDAGHPLVNPTTLVTNSITISEQTPLVLLTGSNMSGKSTFLRTVGANLVLHAMGAPVCAQRLQSAARVVLCAIRVDDSLADGTSYFYAEVQRLRFILETLEANRSQGRPSLFLVDEIFRGTNNRERMLGSTAVLHALLRSGHPGLVSTHDLALTELEGKENGLQNFHFREHVEQGKLVFDYLLRTGPCPTTNALRIMREAGLPIPDNQIAPSQ